MCILSIEFMHYISVLSYLSVFQAALTQFWSLAFTRVAPSFDHLVGILLIVISVGFTLYIGPDKEME